MANTQPLYVDNKNSIERSKPSRSRFLFLLFLFGFFVYIGGCSYSLYTHRFQKNKAPVNSSSLYNPEYK